jgi:hypothetical protein
VRNTSSVPDAQTSPAGPARPLPPVLHISALAPGKKFGSMEEQIVLLGQAFASEGGTFIPVFSCPAEESDPSQFLARGLRAECLDLSRFRLGALWRLLGVVRKYRVGLVHWNFMDPLWNLYTWGLTLLAPRVRHWYTDHISRTGLPPTPPTGWRRRLKSQLLRRYGRVLCVRDLAGKKCTEL